MENNCNFNMFPIILFVTFLSTKYVTRTWSSHTGTKDNLSTPSSFFNWFFDSGMDGMIDTAEKNVGSKAKSVKDCLNLNSKERDVCFHDLGETHRHRAPSTVPVQDLDGNVVAFQESPLEDSFDHGESSDDRIVHTSKSSSSKKLRKNARKYELPTNGDKIIYIEKGDSSVEDMKEGTTTTLDDPYDVHITPISAHNRKNIHDEESSDALVQIPDSSSDESPKTIKKPKNRRGRKIRLVGKSSRPKKIHKKDILPYNFKYNPFPYEPMNDTEDVNGLSYEMGSYFEPHWVDPHFTHPPSSEPGTEDFSKFFLPLKKQENDKLSYNTSNSISGTYFYSFY